MNFERERPPLMGITTSEHEGDRPTSALTPSRRPRWLAFNVRGLMVLVLLTGCGLGWIVHHARLQRNAVAAIRQSGGRVIYDWEATPGRGPGAAAETQRPAQMAEVARRPPRPRLLRHRHQRRDGTPRCRRGHGSCRAPDSPPRAGLRRDTPDRRRDGPPARVDPTQEPPPGGRGADHRLGLKNVEGLTRLQRLTLRNLALADADLVSLRRLTDLRILEISSPRLTDAGMTHLKDLVKLKRLVLTGSRVTSAGLASVGGMTGLQSLSSPGPGSRIWRRSVA